MDRVEALSFIGLKETASQETIMAKYTERKNYYQMLYKNAPNKVIEKIQQLNLNKLDLVRQILLPQIKEKNPAPAGWLENEENAVLGWLIVHTENRMTESFNLYDGVNYIGRRKREDSDKNIVIVDDQFISRTHALIKCRLLSDRYEFKLYDGDGRKPSANGVFLNGKENKISKSCILRENDTIQIGITKLVFKENKAGTTESQEVNSVLNTDFINTIDIEK